MPHCACSHHHRVLPSATSPCAFGATHRARRLDTMWGAVRDARATFLDIGLLCTSEKFSLLSFRDRNGNPIGPYKRHGCRIALRAHTPGASHLCDSLCIFLL